MWLVIQHNIVHAILSGKEEQYISLAAAYTFSLTNAKYVQLLPMPHVSNQFLHLILAAFMFRNVRSFHASHAPPHPVYLGLDRHIHHPCFCTICSLVCACCGTTSQLNIGLFPPQTKLLYVGKTAQNCQILNFYVDLSGCAEGENSLESTTGPLKVWQNDGARPDSHYRCFFPVHVKYVYPIQVHRPNQINAVLRGLTQSYYWRITMGTMEYILLVQLRYGHSPFYVYFNLQRSEQQIKLVSPYMYVSTRIHACTY